MPNRTGLFCDHPPFEHYIEYFVVIVLRRNRNVEEEIQTSPIHHEYTKYMRDVDVADQLEHLIVARVDYTNGRTWCKNGETLSKTMTHLQFHLYQKIVPKSRHPNQHNYVQNCQIKTFEST